MGSGSPAEEVLRLASSGVPVDAAAQRLLDAGPDADELVGVEDLLRRIDADPSALDRALLLIERTRVLAERGAVGEERSDRLRADAQRVRREGAVEPDLAGGLLRHELATPIAAATMSLELLAAHQDGTVPREQLLDIALRNVRSAGRLLQTWGRAEHLRTGSAELSWAQVDLGELVRDCVADVEVLETGHHEVTVGVERPVVLPADPDALRQIVLNLLTNAAKFSPEGSEIEVTVAATGDDAEVAVRDHGSGVAPGDRERIFEAGVRGSRDAPGTGLGLYVADQLAHAHGGGVRVEAATDGARFVLRLPLSSLEWQRSIGRREDAVGAREASQRQRSAIADARDAALDQREAVADQRDAVLGDREALARDRDAELDQRDEP